MIERVWPGIFVDESAVRVHVAAIRKAFGNDREMLSTTIGRGYRLLGAWQVRQASTGAQPAGLEPMKAAVGALSTNVPAATYDLVGRDSAIAYVQELLSAYRIVTLAGPGGIGKTALALELTRLLSASHHTESLFVELASLAKPSLVPSALASVLGIKLEGEEISPEAIARRSGQDSSCFFSNCEHSWMRSQAHGNDRVAVPTTF